MVPEGHGLGIYRGIEKIEAGPCDQGLYQGGVCRRRKSLSSGYPPGRDQKYAGADAKTPKLNKLGGAEWGKTKTRVRTAVREIAKELVGLYAARQDAEEASFTGGHGLAEGI